MMGNLPSKIIDMCQLPSPKKKAALIKKTAFASYKAKIGYYL